MRERDGPTGADAHPQSPLTPGSAPGVRGRASRPSCNRAGSRSVYSAAEAPTRSLHLAQLKAWLLGTHRGVGADQLPFYLDEFVFRWNRRHAPMAGFQALLGLGTHYEPTTYEQILGRIDSDAPRRRGRNSGLTSMLTDPGGPRRQRP